MWQAPPHDGAVTGPEKKYRAACVAYNPEHGSGGALGKQGGHGCEGDEECNQGDKQWPAKHVELRATEGMCDCIARAY